MEVVLSILNVLGWILLIFILFVIMVLLFVLFHPICYELEGKFDQTVWVQAKAEWLFRLCRIRAVYEEELFFVEMKLAGFQKNVTHEFKDGDTEDTETEDTDEAVSSEVVVEDLSDVVLDNEEPNTADLELVVEDLEDEVEDLKKPEGVHDTEDTEHTEHSERIISKIKGMINRIQTIYPKIKKIITDKRNQAAISHIKRELIYLIKLFLPKKSQVDAIFSAGSPDTTGKTYGVIVCLPIIYRDHWQLLPDFEAENAYF